MPILGPDGKRLLGPAKTTGYKPIRQEHFERYRDLPIFSFEMIRWMLFDPTVRLGLAMRAAPLCNAEFAYKEGQEWIPGIRVEGGNEEVGQFILRQLKRFWRHELLKMLQAQIWGWSAAEVTYRFNKITGRVEMNRTLSRHARDVFAQVKGGDIVGVKFTRLKGEKGEIKLPVPKCYWHAFDSEAESPYGRSILKGAYSPWADKNLEGGACDVRRLYMHKDAYAGMHIQYPAGSTPIDGDDVPNRDIAREAVEQHKSGGVMTTPSEIDPTTGEKLWVVEYAKTNSNPAHILQYPKDLDVEILRGIEIPDDVVTSEATGAWQGKQVPMLAFYTSGDRWLSDVVRVVVTQILEPLVMVNWGKAINFEVETKPLAEQAMEQMGEGEQEGTPMPNPMPMPMPNVQQQPTQMGLERAIASTEGMAAQLVMAGRKLLNGTNTNGKRKGMSNGKGKADS